MQGLALGLNAGLGNFGVTTMQMLIPLSMTVGMFGAMGGDPMTLIATSGTLVGKIPAGTETYIQNAGFIWLLFLVPLAFFGWFGMNNIRTEEVSPATHGSIASMAMITGMLAISFIAAIFGLWLMLPEAVYGSGFKVPKEIALFIVIALTVSLLKIIPGQIGQSLERQYKFLIINILG